MNSDPNRQSGTHRRYRPQDTADYGVDTVAANALFALIRYASSFSRCTGCERVAEGQPCAGCVVALVRKVAQN